MMGGGRLPGCVQRTLLCFPSCLSKFCRGEHLRSTYTSDACHLRLPQLAMTPEEMVKKMCVADMRTMIADYNMYKPKDPTDKNDTILDLPVAKVRELSKKIFEKRIKEGLTGIPMARYGD